MKNTCSGCVFFESSPREVVDGGWCRRFPPTPLCIVYTENGEFRVRSFSNFAQVRDDSPACGEFRPKAGVH